MDRVFIVSAWTHTGVQEDGLSKIIGVVLQIILKTHLMLYIIFT